MHENRETSVVSERSDRSGKARSRKPDMYAAEESDCAVVPMKSPNKGASALAEAVEGRARTKENAVESRRSPTQSGERLSQGLGSVGRVARERNLQRRYAASSEVGAVCGSSARTDLRRPAMAVPTAKPMWLPGARNH